MDHLDGRFCMLGTDDVDAAMPGGRGQISALIAKMSPIQRQRRIQELLQIKNIAEKDLVLLNRQITATCSLLDETNLQLHWLASISDLPRADGDIIKDNNVQLSGTELVQPIYSELGKRTRPPSIRPEDLPRRPPSAEEDYLRTRKTAGSLEAELPNCLVPFHAMNSGISGGVSNSRRPDSACGSLSPGVMVTTDSLTSEDALGLGSYGWMTKWKASKAASTAHQQEVLDDREDVIMQPPGECEFNLPLPKYAWGPQVVIAEQARAQTTRLSSSPHRHSSSPSCASTPTGSDVTPRALPASVRGSWPGVQAGRRGSAPWGSVGSGYTPGGSSIGSDFDGFETTDPTIMNEDFIDTRGCPRFTDDEHASFVAGYEFYNNQPEWEGIASKFVTTRTAAQVADHAQSIVNSLRRKVRDADSSVLLDDKALLDLVVEASRCGLQRSASLPYRLSVGGMADAPSADGPQIKHLSRTTSNSNPELLAQSYNQDHKDSLGGLRSIRAYVKSGNFTKEAKARRAHAALERQMTAAANAALKAGMQYRMSCNVSVSDESDPSKTVTETIVPTELTLVAASPNSSLPTSPTLPG